jgi:hypothetical protein
MNKFDNLFDNLMEGESLQERMPTQFMNKLINDIDKQGGNADNIFDNTRALESHILDTRNIHGKKVYSDKTYKTFQTLLNLMGYDQVKNNNRSDK